MAHICPKFGPFSPDRLRETTRRQHADGLGDIIFKREVSDYSHHNHMSMQAVGLLAIDHVKEVEDRIRQVVKERE